MYSNLSFLAVVTNANLSKKLQSMISSNPIPFDCNKVRIKAASPNSFCGTAFVDSSHTSINCSALSSMARFKNEISSSASAMKVYLVDYLLDGLLRVKKEVIHGPSEVENFPFRLIPQLHCSLNIGLL